MLSLNCHTLMQPGGWLTGFFEAPPTCLVPKCTCAGRLLLLLLLTFIPDAAHNPVKLFGADLKRAVAGVTSKCDEAY